MFQTTQTAGRPYCTAVATTLGSIRNPPSPTTAATARSGAASRAPSAPATPNPIAANPQLCRSVPGPPDSHSWTIQLWCAPTSESRIASGGSAPRSSASTRAGCRGTASDPRDGATCRRHSSRQPATSDSHRPRVAGSGRARAPPAWARASSARCSWRRTMSARAWMPTATG
ncbi:MAG TPA: hypothetical protein VH021_16100 [Trebonia sp.]|nr:hypothetical protein [Trebonia sp.]